MLAKTLLLRYRDRLSDERGDGGGALRPALEGGAQSPLRPQGLPPLCSIGAGCCWRGMTGSRIRWRTTPQAGEIGAVKHSIIVACAHMLTTGELHRELGGDYLTRLDKQTRRRVAQLQRPAFGEGWHRASATGLGANPLVSRD